MKYQLYRPISYSLQKTMDKAAKLIFSKQELKKYKSLSLWAAFSMMARRLNYDDTFLATSRSNVDALLYRYEYLWASLNDGRRLVVFPSHNELIKIEKSSFRNVDISLLADDVFSVAVDPNYKHPPFMVSLCSKNSIVSADNIISNEMNLKDYGALDYRPFGDKYLTIAIAEIETRNGHVGYTYSIEVIMDNDIQALIEHQTFDGWFTHIKGGELERSEKLSKEERERIWRISKLAANILMYRHVFPEKIISGSPPVSAKNSMGKLPIRAVDIYKR